MRIFFLIFLLFNISYSADLQNLLDDYELATTNEISQKTKKESLGHLITYTQQDLHMMQARVLKDVLKTLPKISVQTNNYGISNLTYAGNPNSTSTSMRVYIDDQEMSSVESLSPWALYADYPLDHISHIECYFGDSTIQLGNEPGKLTVKLYTKKPYTVSGTILRSSFVSNGSNSQSTVYGEDYIDSSLLLMLNSTKIDNPTYIVNNENIENDSNNAYGYFAYRQDEYKLSGGFSQIKKNDFLSLAYDATPDYTKRETTSYYLEGSKKFNDSNGKIYISYNETNKKATMENKEGILYIPILDLSNIYSTMSTYVNEDITYKKYDFGLSNNFVNDKHSLFLATAIKHKDTNVNSIDVTYLDTTSDSGVDISRIDSETIYSLLSEYSYSLNDSNILIANLKYDNYQKEGGVHSFDFVTPRVGYISTINENVSLKLFATKTFTPPSMGELNYSAKDHPDLNEEVKDIYTFETSYEDEQQKLTLFLNHIKFKDMIILDYEKAGYVNYNGNFDANGFEIRYEKYINHNNKFDINYYSYVNSANTYGSSRTGGTFRAYQMLGKLDFYEELIYKNGYEYNKILKIDDSHNLSLGLRYNFSKNLELSVKANNILDDDMDIAYTNYSSMSLFTLPNSNRIYTTTIKWTF